MISFCLGFQRFYLQSLVLVFFSGFSKFFLKSFELGNVRIHVEVGVTDMIPSDLAAGHDSSANGTERVANLGSFVIFYLAIFLLYANLASRQDLSI